MKIGKEAKNGRQKSDICQKHFQSLSQQVKQGAEHCSATYQSMVEHLHVL